MSQKKRNQIKSYFFPYPKPKYSGPKKEKKDSIGTGVLTAGILLIILGLTLVVFRKGIGVIAILLGVALLMNIIHGVSRNNSRRNEYKRSLKKYQSRLGNWGLAESDMAHIPTGKQIDKYLQEDLKNIEEYALTEKLGLVRKQLKRDPLIIYGPLFWKTYGIPDKDLVYVKEKPTNFLRFSCYQVVIVFLTDAWVATYTCDFNFLRNARLGEKTVEYLYQDIVSVSTEEISTNYTLPDGKTLQRAKVFRLAVASGDRIEVVVNSSQLKDMLDGTLNLEDQDKNVQIIREMLRSKKG